MRTQLFIGGEWCDPAAGSAALFEVGDPATLEKIESVADAGERDVDRAIAAAHGAQPSWAALAPRERGEILRRAWELMVAEQEDFATLIVRENGKALADARSEVAYAAEFFRWFAEEAVRIDGDMRRSPSGRNWIMVTQEALGVAVLVTPWNYPAAMATRKIAPALAAGCTVVLKPAAETPLTALALADLMERAGVPAGVLNVLTTRRSAPAVAQMLSDRRVRGLSFTGSTEVGRLLLAQSAGNVIRASMELGGNAPFLVLADADIDQAVDGLMVAKLRNGGSACTAANRIYVADAIADDFTDAFVDRMNRVRMGNGLDPSTDLGPLVNAPTRGKVAELVDAAVSDGARLRSGGRSPDLPGYFYQPTVLSDVAPDSSILQTEIFGPVAPLVRFQSVDEAVAMANDSQYGLIAYLYTRDLEFGMTVSRRLEAGMIGLNRGVVSDPAAPFGGVKHSGIGREGAHDGIREFLETKYTALPFG